MRTVSDHIALLQDDVDPEDATEEEALLAGKMEEVSGFVVPEKRAPLLQLAGQCN